MSSSHYSFGDNERAALRLDYLAAAIAPSSRSFLQDAKPDRVQLALDLGRRPMRDGSGVYRAVTERLI